jgi:hypothetical protein
LSFLLSGDIVVPPILLHIECRQKEKQAKAAKANDTIVVDPKHKKIVYAPSSILIFTQMESNRFSKCQR